MIGGSPRLRGNAGWAFVPVGVGLRPFAGGRPERGTRFRRATELFLLALSLFPVISAGDHLVRFVFLGSNFHTHSRVGSAAPEGTDSQRNAPALVQALGALDAVQVARRFTFTALESTFATVEPLVVSPSEWESTVRSGRAPPSVPSVVTQL